SRSSSWRTGCRPQACSAGSWRSATTPSGTGTGWNPTRAPPPRGDGTTWNDQWTGSGAVAGGGVDRFEFVVVVDDVDDAGPDGDGAADAHSSFPALSSRPRVEGDERVVVRPDRAALVGGDIDR